MKSFRELLHILKIICVFVVIAPCLYAYEDFDIVILHSYEKGNTWTDRIDETFKKSLEPGQHSTVFYSEYMDSKRFFGPDYDQSLLEIYHEKFKDKVIDLVITSDDYAFDFAIKYRHEIFNNAPIIFSGVNGYNKEKEELLKKEGNFTGVVETFDIVETINLALDIHPKAKKLYIINTKYTPSGRYLKRQFEDALKTLRLNIPVEFIESYDMEEVYDISTTFEKDSIVIFGAYARDRSGNYYTFEENMRKLSEHSTRPIYGFLGFYMGNGLTGGYLTNGYIHGGEIARMANEYLRGKKISEIPVVKKSINQLVFDYDKLKRYDIDLWKVIFKSTIISKDNKFFYILQHYKVELIILVSSFLCLIICFLVLLYFFEEQKRYRENLEEENELLEDRVNERTIQLVQQQSKLINTARLASLGEMASGIAHEINNPLAIIELSATRIIQRSSDAKVKSFAERASATTTRISKIIRGLKNLSKNGDKGSFKKFAVVDMIEDISSICSERFRDNYIKLEINLNDNLVAFGSVIQISQVLLNLLNNAFDELNTLEEGRERKVILDSGEVEIDGQPYIQLSVTDTGNGISEEIRQQIMEPFFTTKVKLRGTGLGLSICQNIVEQHKGNFFLDEDYPQTRFVIQIPKMS